MIKFHPSYLYNNVIFQKAGIVRDIPVCQISPRLPVPLFNSGYTNICVNTDTPFKGILAQLNSRVLSGVFIVSITSWDTIFGMKYENIKSSTF